MRVSKWLNIFSFKARTKPSRAKDSDDDGLSLSGFVFLMFVVKLMQLTALLIFTSRLTSWCDVFQTQTGYAMRWNDWMLKESLRGIDGVSRKGGRESWKNKENWALMNHSETRNVYLKTYDSYIIPLERNKGPNESLVATQSIHRKKGCQIYLEIACKCL